MRIFIINCLLIAYTLINVGFSQNYPGIPGICTPYSAYSCETAKQLCEDEHYNFCSCPGYFTPNLFYSTLVYSFEVTQNGQSVDIQIGGDWGQVSTTLVGPFTFDSDCVTPIPSDPSNLISIQQVDASIGTVNLPNVFGKYFILIVGVGINNGDVCPFIDINFTPDKACITEPCENCIGSFAPMQDKEYLIGAWAKVENAPPTMTTYTVAEIYVVCEVSSSSTPVTFGPFIPQGAIIDGWQRIEEKIHIPADATSIQIKLTSTSGNVFYDDIRMFPFDASMKSYVYDPINMRLAAELDERHYATFYEYDEEGKLVRIKKETEKGVMTIQETKSNSAK